ncbi:hypothetical protein WCWAEYFT_CDS0219 [Vibrio phage VB_VaC_TDDLMA]
MFLSSNYILGNELVQRMDINIANVSIMSKRFEEENDHTTVIKMNNCNFIKSDSPKLPQYIQKGIQDLSLNKPFVDFSDKLPCTWFRSEFELSDKDCINSDIIKDKVKLFGKEFYVFEQSFIDAVKDRICYILDANETKECWNKKQIEGYVQISKKKYMTWYNPKIMVQNQKEF